MFLPERSEDPNWYCSAAWPENRRGGGRSAACRGPVRPTPPGSIETPNDLQTIGSARRVHSARGFAARFGARRWQKENPTTPPARQAARWRPMGLLFEGG